MTPLWIALILIPFGAFILVWVFVTALTPPVEEVDEDDILEEASEEDLDRDAESREIVDISDGDGTARPNVGRPPITMNSSGVRRKPAALPAKAGSKVAKSAGAASSSNTVASLPKIAEAKPAVKSAPTVAANGMPIKPKRFSD
jgi:hypothetical protein